MSDATSTPLLASKGPGIYRLCRAALRIWFSLSFRRIRVLQAEALSRPGAALLVVNHPSSFLDTLILIAAFERRVHCLLEREFLKGSARRLLARSLGLIEFGFQDDEWPSVLALCYQILSRGGVILVFAKQQVASPELPASFAPAATAIAVEALSGVAALPRLAIHAVHLFLPVSPSQSGELLIHIDAPLSFEGGMPIPETGSDDRVKTVDSQLERVSRQNPFRLQPESLEQFLSGIESILREDFEENWARRPNSKQKVEDFEISPFLINLVNQLNYSHPGRLAGLGEALQAYREARRRSALRRLRAEMAGEWLGSTGRRAAVWIETVAGFPVAAYGLVNLLPAWLLLRVSGLLRRGLWNATVGEWVARVIVALACYGGQIALAAYLLSRSEAGYYAPSLPISGLYSLRYLWLLENRTSIVALSWDKQGRARRLRKMRHNLIEEIKRDQDRFALIWKIAH
jgi:1-acyl-sn-glycerol-3-phosphate acyltransferase